jgi:hypothetical protein
LGDAVYDDKRAEREHEDLAAKVFAELRTLLLSLKRELKG